MQISVIFTGGTIGSKLHGSSIGTDSAAPRELLARYRAASGDETAFKTVEPYTILSENLTLPHLTTLARAISEELKEADGVIVTHGTDSLPYTATALSYILGLNSKPVVLVSSNYILSDPRANGLDHFRAAVDFLRAASSARGVYVAYRNGEGATHILRAARLLAHLAPTDTVYTLNGTVATWENGIISTAPAYTEQTDEIAPLCAEALTKAPKRVLFLRAHPDMLFPPITEDTDAVLIETYHSGTLPTDSAALAAFTAKAREKSVPIFAVGITGEKIYESATRYPALGITPLPPLSPVAAYLKLHLALSNGLDPQKTLPRSLGGDM
ncbi:MAG: asparaginase [Clostridia bacterium]|nr:asparaginase [Clostridia bacterium]